MSEDLVSQVAEEIARIAELALEEQPAAFSGIRDLLENELNGTQSASRS